MADLDVSFLLSDDLFVDSFNLIRRTSSLNTSGENVLVESKPAVFKGSVQIASQKDIERLPEALRSHEAIRIYSKEQLSSDSSGDYADIVLWKNSRWQVKVVDDWSNYGAGYVKAICVMEKPSFG